VPTGHPVCGVRFADRPDLAGAYETRPEQRWLEMIAFLPFLAKHLGFVFERHLAQKQQDTEREMSDATQEILVGVVDFALGVQYSVLVLDERFEGMFRPCTYPDKAGRLVTVG
jgi:hypothetical protein